MAERRMFSLKIIDSDAFIDMPQSSQLLYFHLAMRADDDGFINSPKKIQRMVGCSDDDLKVLITKKFIIPFESGIVVIKHWKIHNYIAKDRYHETNYKEEKALLMLDENNSYTQCNTFCIQNDDRGKVRLGKDKIDNKLSIYLSQDEKTKINNAAYEFMDGVSDRQIKLLYKLGADHGVDNLLNAMYKAASKNNVGDFIAYVKTIVTQNEILS